MNLLNLMRTFKNRTPVISHVKPIFADIMVELSRLLRLPLQRIPASVAISSRH